MGQPESIIELAQFSANQDQEIVIQVSQLVLLMPIFRWVGDHWQDATGEFDLCMEPDGKTYKFMSRIMGAQRYGYRYVPIAYLTRKYSLNGL